MWPCSRSLWREAALLRRRSLRQTPLGLVEITERAMAKIRSTAMPMQGRCWTHWIAIHDPSITFLMFISQRTGSCKGGTKAHGTKRDRRQPSLQLGPPAEKPRSKRRSVFLPVLLGTLQWPLPGLREQLCWSILQDQPTLMNERPMLPWATTWGYDRDEVNAPAPGHQRADPHPVRSIINDYAAGYVYRQSPVSAVPCMEGQTITLTVSLGTKYITVPDLANYLQTDAEPAAGQGRLGAGHPGQWSSSVATGRSSAPSPQRADQVAAGTMTVICMSAVRR